MTEETALVKVEELNVEKVFSDGGVDPILQKIREQVTGFVPNLETATGRKEIASLAHKVARSKTLLDGLGKDLVSAWKQKAKVVDNERKRMRDYLDSLKDEVRQPLTEWENAEKERVQKLEERIESMKCGDDALSQWMTIPLDVLSKTLADLKAISIDESFEEYAPEAASVKDKNIAKLEQAITQREKHDAEQAELERLRREQAEREEKEREERIRKEAEERAKREAEEKARIERERLEREREEAIRKHEEAERAAKEAAEKAERERIAAEERAKIEKEMAVREAERKAKKEADRKEAERVAKEKAEREEAERKAANKRHRAKVEAEAIESLVSLGIESSTAAEIISHISSGKVKNVTVNY